MVPRKFRAHVTPCIRKLYLDDASDASQKSIIQSLEAQLRAERAKVAELQQEREAIVNERDSLYRVINVYKEREKELEAKDRRQKFQNANQIDELMHTNQRLQSSLDEAQTLLSAVGLGSRTTPPPSSSRPVPSTPRSSSISSRPSIFATPTTSRPLVFTQSPLSPLKGGLAIAREDLQARLRVTSTGSPSKVKLGDKRQRDMQDDMDMSSSEEEDPDQTVTIGGSRRPLRASGILGRSVRRKYDAHV
ncbi:hypothetical protein CPB86DRAFT_741549 [Serendipita vermifera]|nr:hypothetical protein CPB86DRAFT_741549 [Serendipita vermifera]